MEIKKLFILAMSIVVVKSLIGQTIYDDCILEQFNKQEYDSALVCARLAMDNLEQNYGITDTNYALSLGTIGEIFWYQGNYDSCAFYNSKCTKILETAKYSNKIEYANRLTFLSMAYQKLEIFAKADSLYQIAYEVFSDSFDKLEELTGEVMANLIMSNLINNRGVLQEKVGNYSEAERSYIKSKEIIQKYRGIASLEYFQALNNLGNLYRYLGNYYLSDKYLDSAKIICEHFYPDRIDILSKILNNYGALYQSLGNTDSALVYFNKAQILRKELCNGGVSEEFCTEYATTLNNIGTIYDEKEQDSLAEEYYLAAANMDLSILGPDHTSYAIDLNNLGKLYLNRGNLLKADMLFNTVEQIYLNTLGPSHPLFAEVLNNRGLVKSVLGDYSEALKLFNEASIIFEEKLGPSNNAFAEILLNKAKVFNQMGRMHRAEKYYEKGFDIFNKNISESVIFLSEQEKESFLDKFRIPLDDLYHFALQNYTHDDRITGLALNTRLAYKYIVLNSLITTRKLIYASGDTTLINSYLRWFDFNLWISRLQQQGKEKAEFWGYDFNNLEKQLEAYEKEISRISAGSFNINEDQELLTWKGIQERLTDDAAYIEIMNLDPDPSDKTNNLLYFAFIVTKNCDQPFLEPLFNEKSLINVIQKDKFTEDSLFIPTIYSYPRSSPNDSDSESDISLYHLTWESIEKHLEGISRIYLSPSGATYNLSFGSIQAPDGRRLLDKYDYIYITTPISLNQEQEELNFEDKFSVTIFYGIDYDFNQDTSGLYTKKNESENPIDERMNLSFSATRANNLDIILKGSLLEGDSVVNILEKSNIDYLKIDGNKATEESFYSVSKSSPSVIHISTHGFYISEEEFSKMKVRNTITSSHNPLLRSGLCFAGCNRAFQGNASLESADGILTAFEISNTNLTGVKLVLLSACSTARGDVIKDQVWGLQRGLKLSGADFMILSLWEIPDMITMELIISFYLKWIDQKMSLIDALNAAQQETRDKYGNVYNWGGFVLYH